ncbi:hypothetical protein COT97_00430 [Candidatus Falkowbacteria bacterium CG10_big_fil_rev_8_21_14_0_10_39_11]|uniref:Uncharacterized protein n=1 Tax=Candidatus Falkowbacteria bacterium CG10_big_fil_rev_8_21_14_0_10_39_11 TaxID=1974565 RepID=A0A2H0V674_9BACT|nr:MAG: hypothetical protein COT97_00430 [Candidatus Falkowbacteria bacterium CG10_big_fil_rev_8_21_14_0_10_39_11]
MRLTPLTEWPQTWTTVEKSKNAKLVQFNPETTVTWLEVFLIGLLLLGLLFGGFVFLFGEHNNSLVPAWEYVTLGVLVICGVLVGGIMMFRAIYADKRMKRLYTQYDVDEAKFIQQFMRFSYRIKIFNRVFTETDLDEAKLSVMTNVFMNLTLMFSETEDFLSALTMLQLRRLEPEYVVDWIGLLRGTMLQDMRLVNVKLGELLATQA